MQESMTGYGNDERTFRGFHIKTEIKTLNSKFLDFSFRAPKELASKENEIKSIITDKLKRGKVILNLELATTENNAPSLINKVLFERYYHELNTLAERSKTANDIVFQLAVNAPDVFIAEELNPENLPWEEILQSIHTTIAQCVTYRKDEGKNLVKKLKEYIESIRKNLHFVEQQDPLRTENIKKRLKSHLKDLKDAQIDQNRFEQEVIYYLEKLDISEEKVRLRNHLDYFIEVIDKEEIAGKKLGFISQEIGREINTIGSKANDALIQRYVVQMKDDLEKIKEQLLNIL